MSDAGQRPPEEELIYDWNDTGGALTWSREPTFLDLTAVRAELAPPARRPTRDHRLALVRGAGPLKLESQCIGRLPEDSEDLDWLLKRWNEVAPDVQPAVELALSRTALEQAEQLSRRHDLQLACLLPVPLSRLQRQACSEDPLGPMLEWLGGATNLQMTLVFQDASRAHPEDLVDRLQTVLAEAQNVTAVCLCDDAGQATEHGVVRLVGVAREVLRRRAPEVRLEWSGDNARGLALSNALVALREGVQRVHGSVFGLGEGAGCVPLDLLLVNLKLLGGLGRPLEGLRAFCQIVADTVGTEVLANYPVLGADAFRTGTGVHAAAIIKAEKKGHAWLADRIYSGVPAGLFGLHQVIEVGPMAGASNVHYWLARHGLEPTEQRIEQILSQAKSSNRVLTGEEILAVIGE